MFDCVAWALDSGLVFNAYKPDMLAGATTALNKPTALMRANSDFRSSVSKFALLFFFAPLAETSEMSTARRFSTSRIYFHRARI